MRYCSPRVFRWLLLCSLSTLWAMVLDVRLARANSSGHLVVADIEAEKIYVYTIPELELTEEFDGIRMAEHSGFLPINGNRVLFVNEEPSDHSHEDEGDEEETEGEHEHGEEEGDEAGGELIVLKLDLNGKPAIVGRAPVGAPASHIAVHPDMTYAVAGSSDKERILSIVDLRWWSPTRYETLTTAAIPSEDPGVAIGGHPPVVYHRYLAPDFNSGRLEAYPLGNLFTSTFDPTGTVALETSPHGEIISHRLKQFCSATDTGFVCGKIDGDTLTSAGELPYNVSGRSEGRAFFVRLANDQKRFYSYLRIFGSDTTPWEGWENDAYIGNLATGEAVRIPLGPGLVYRQALSDPFALYFTLHPDGDAAHLLDTNPKSPTFHQLVASIPLDPLSNPPLPGGDPFDAESRRVAITPDGRWGFISHGGDGTISVIDTQSKQVVRKLEVPTPLTAGGYLIAVQPKTKFGDTIGR